MNVLVLDHTFTLRRISIYSKWSGLNLVYSVKTTNYFVESKKTTWMIEFTQDLVLTLGVLSALAKKTF